MKHIIILTLLFSCSMNTPSEKNHSNDLQEENKIKSTIDSNLIENIDNNKTIEDKMYKYQLIKSDDKVIESDKLMKSMKSIENIDVIDLIINCQLKAQKDRIYVSGPPFIQLYIKNRYTNDKHIYYYFMKVNNEPNKYFFYYFDGGFKAGEISPQIIKSILEYVNEPAPKHMQSN